MKTKKNQKSFYEYSILSDAIDKIKDLWKKYIEENIVSMIIIVFIMIFGIIILLLKGGI